MVTPPHLEARQSALQSQYARVRTQKLRAEQTLPRAQFSRAVICFALQFVRSPCTGMPEKNTFGAASGERGTDYDTVSRFG